MSISEYMILLSITITLSIVAACTNLQFPISEFENSEKEVCQIKSSHSDSGFIIQDLYYVDKFLFMLRTSKKEVRKFAPNYTVTIGDKNLLINTHWIKYKGITYRSDNNIEYFIKKSCNFREETQ